MKELASQDPSTLSNHDLVAMARKIEGALDVLFMAYAKAENMHPDPDNDFSELRSYWGQFSQAYVAELLKDV